MTVCSNSLPSTLHLGQDLCFSCNYDRAQFSLCISGDYLSEHREKVLTSKAVLLCKSKSSS